MLHAKGGRRVEDLRALFIAPHPDDETIGAGGVIARHVASGDEVFWCIVTQGYTPHWSEDALQKATEQIDAVWKVYGFKKVYRLGFPTVKINTVPHIDWCNALQVVFDESKPSVVQSGSSHCF